MPGPPPRGIPSAVFKFRKAIRRGTLPILGRFSVAYKRVMWEASLLPTMMVTEGSGSPIKNTLHPKGIEIYQRNTDSPPSIIGSIEELQPDFRIRPIDAAVLVEVRLGKKAVVALAGPQARFQQLEVLEIQNSIPIEIP